MIPVVENTYQDLLTPIKDPEKSFQVNIAQLLLAYVRNFRDGKGPANFNSAALLLQGSSCIYSKKVEYLHNLATQLYHNLMKQKKDDTAKKDTNNKVKDKNKDRFNDPFFSTDIKMGKNLSCLRKKNNVTTTKNAALKKSSKKGQKKPTFVPVDLLPFEGEEKGEVFYDTRGEAIGNKGDYTLNKCRVTNSGWLVIPTVCMDLVPTTNSLPDYSIDMGWTDNHCDSDSDMPHCTPDEGIDIETPLSSQAPSSQGCTLSQQTDEGLGSMTSSQPISEIDEPTNGVECSSAEPQPHDAMDIQADAAVADLDTASKLVRRSMRQAEKAMLNEAPPSTTAEDENNNKEGEEEIPVVKKAIQKKNTCYLPSKLRASNANRDGSESVSQFCARTFFSVDNKALKNGMFPIETAAFRNNSNFLKKLQERYDALKAATRKNKKAEEDPEEDDEVDIETFNDPDPDDMMIQTPLEDDDIVINNDLNDLPLPESGPPSRELSNIDPPPSTSDEGPMPAPETVARELEDIRRHTELEKNAEIAAKVKEWQDRIAPFLNELEHREAFDINLYGGRILNSFEPTEEGKQRRQTKTFREFCKGMQKWQIHRYFMALLPLANIGNVELEAEERSDGEEEIMITLISKRMHHLRLEEFGNDDDEEEEH